MQSRKAAFLGFCESLQSRYIHTHAAFLSLLMCLYKEENWGHCVSNVVLRLNGNGAMPKPALETIGMLSRLLLLALLGLAKKSRTKMMGSARMSIRGRNALRHSYPPPEIGIVFSSTEIPLWDVDHCPSHVVFL